MWKLLALVLLCPLVQPFVIGGNPQSFYGLADVIANIVTVDNTELVFISDFTLQQQVRE
jgi:hypothetical protein